LKNTTKKGWYLQRLKAGPARSNSDLSAEDLSDDHRAAIEGWKTRKDQLHKQQQSVMDINDEAEKVNLLSLSKQKDGNQVGQ
jgi:hypothetical protein